MSSLQAMEETATRVAMEESTSTSLGPSTTLPAEPTLTRSETEYALTVPSIDIVPNKQESQDSCIENVSNTEQVGAEQVFFKVIDSDSNIVHIQSANKQRIVNITAIDDRPTIYKIHPPQVTDPFMPWKVPEAFSGLPFVGVVRDNSELMLAQQFKIKEFVGDNLSNEQFERLELYCSPDNLRLGNEVKVNKRGDDRDFGFDYMEVTDSSGRREAEAETLNILKKHTMRVDMDESNIYIRKLKYRGFRYLPLRNDFLPVTSGDDALVPGKDLLFRIRVYRPFDYNPRSAAVWSVASTSRCPIFTHDLILTGRHTLAAIRDSIPCINETNLRVDISDHPKKKPPVSCKTLFPSGFLFINNAFYNDHRPNCLDLSVPIVEWARRNKLGDFPKFSLDTRLDQITIKLGFPDVYVHQGDCEHTFCFADVRLVTASDPLNPAAYPTQTFVSKSHEAYCTTCADKIATRLVAGCVRVPFDPAFMCDTCFDMYLYDKDGKKICNFAAYNFIKE